VTRPIVHPLAGKVRVQVHRAMPELPAALDAEVERLWQLASARMARGRAGPLFNGRVISAERITPALITGHLTEFRRVVAQYEQPALFGELGLRPLAVSGVLCCTDGVVIGRRNMDAVILPGMWQLPPAGSVDASVVAEDGSVDLQQQLRLELQEELGLPPDCIDAPRTLCVAEHPVTRVSSVGMQIRTTLDAGAVLAAHRTGGNAEYAPLKVVPWAELPRFIAQLGDRLVPSALPFLVRAGLLPGGNSI